MRRCDSTQYHITTGTQTSNESVRPYGERSTWRYPNENRMGSPFTQDLVRLGRVRKPPAVSQDEKLRLDLLAARLGALYKTETAT